MSEISDRDEFVLTVNRLMICAMEDIDCGRNEAGPTTLDLVQRIEDHDAALRAENERLALSLVDAEDRLAAALDDRAFLLELLGITVKTGTKDPLLDARLAEARAFLAGGKTK